MIFTGSFEKHVAFVLFSVFGIFLLLLLLLHAMKPVNQRVTNVDDHVTGRHCYDIIHIPVV